MEQDAVREQIRALLQGQPFGVLCTQGGGQPYGSVVAFAYDDDLCSLAFATPEGTFKYRQLCECDRVAMVIDTRAQHPGDARRASALTSVGRAVRLQPGSGLQEWQARLQERHPDLAAFFGAENTAIFGIHVDRHKLTTQFQNVQVWEPHHDIE